MQQNISTEQIRKHILETNLWWTDRAIKSLEEVKRVHQQFITTCFTNDQVPEEEFKDLQKVFKDIRGVLDNMEGWAKAYHSRDSINARIQVVLEDERENKN